jgi:GNAT superfamily N-acetyltransferase
LTDSAKSCHADSVKQTQAVRSDVVIRQASGCDAAELAAMLSALSDLSLYFRFQTAIGRPPRPAVLDQLLQPTGTAWLAERSGRIIGHAMWAWAKGMTTAGPTAELAVVVADSDQRQGIGAELISVAASDARTAGADQFLVVVSAANDPVVRLVRRRWPDVSVERDGPLLNFLAPAHSAGFIRPVPGGEPVAVGA